VVHLHDEGDLVDVGAGDGAEHPERGGDGVAAALERQLDDVARVEVLRVGGEAGGRGVLDPLVDGEDGHVPGAGQAAVIEQRL
jgi:hypothetical protein